MSTVHYERLAAELLNLGRRIDGLGSGPQLAFSSIEGGAIDEYDRDGNLVGSIGEQYDGTHGAISLGGPKPPRPEAPTVDAGTTVTLGWNGYFVDPVTGKRDVMITAPMDWSRAEIHMSQTSGFVADSADTLVDTIETPRGGTRPALPGPGVWYAVLVARSLSGKSSAQSEQTRFEVAQAVTEETIQAIRDDFAGVADGLAEDLRQNTVAQGGLNDRLTNLQEEVLPALEQELGSAGERLDAADTLLNETFPKRISDAEKAAAAAQLTANMVPLGNNLVPDPGAEARAVGDVVAPGWTVTTAQKRRGAKSVQRLTGTAAGARWVVATVADPVPGDVWRFSAWTMNTSTYNGTAANTVLRIANQVNTNVAAKSHTLGTTWTQTLVDYTVPATGAPTQLQFQIGGDGTAGILYVDDVEVQNITGGALAREANTKAAAAEAAAVQAAADLVTAKARADTAATAATTAAAEAAAAEASSARATGAAGEAETAADTARQSAAAALAQAQNAGGNVATAQAAATAAQTAADASKAAASTAGTAAANADAKAAQAAADAAKAAADAVTAASKATTAAGEATTAKTAATTAASKATAAETAAATAAGKATASATDAATATAKAAAAEAASTKASGAAGVAEAAADKARIDAGAALTQATNSGSNATAAQTAANAAKAASDAAATASSKAGTAAAAADAAAAKAAADAAQAAADLIVARNAAADARGDADTALDRADSAIIAAGSTARVLYSTGNPSGTAREGDTWRKTSSDVGPVVAEWRYTRNAAGTLAWRTQQVTGDMISNLDVGRLTVGTGAFTQAVFEKMAAQTAAIQKADIGNLTVTETSTLNNVVAERIAAKVGLFVEVYASKIVADEASFKSGVAEKFAAATGSFVRLYASQVFIGDGGNLLPDPAFRDTTTTAGRAARSTGTWTLVPGTATEPAAMQHTMSSANDAFQYWPNLPSSARTNEVISVTPGQIYRLSVDVTTSAAGVVRWNAYLLKADGSVSYAGLTSMPSASGRRPVAQDYTIPAGVVGIAFAVACLTSTAGTFTVHGNGSVTQKITPSLVVDGLVSGQNIIGAIIQTQATASRGVKITDDGLFAYSSTGVETLRFDGANSIITGATLRTAASGTRIQISTAGGLEGWAGSTRYLKADANGLEIIGSVSSKGMTFEPTPRPIEVMLDTVARAAYTGTAVFTSPGLVFYDGLPIAKAAGVFSPDGYQIQMNGRRNTNTSDSMGIFSLSQDVSSLDAKSVRIGNFNGLATVYTQTSTVDIGGAVTTITANDIKLDGRLLVNGTVYGTPETRERVAIASTWTHHTISGWNGLWIEQVGKLTIISGAVSRSAAWGGGGVVATLPVKYRPPNQVAGAGCEVTTAGELRLPAGSGAVSFFITYFAA